MVIVNDGLKNVRKFLANSGGHPPTSIMLGEDGSAVSENDVWLGSPVDSTEKGFSVTPVEGEFTVRYEHILNSIEGNGYDFKEFILLDSTNNSVYSHDLFTNVNKTAAFEMQTAITVKVLNEE